MPFQYLLADAILCMGGSTVFNRLGIVASLDTHDRIATAVVTQHINKGSGGKQGEEKLAWHICAMCPTYAQCCDVRSGVTLTGTGSAISSAAEYFIAV